jgi:hypothetical protein
MGGRDNGMGVRVNMRQEQGEYAYDDDMIDDLEKCSRNRPYNANA